MFGKSSDESLKGFDEMEMGLNSIKEENNTNEEMANKKNMSKRPGTWRWIGLLWNAIQWVNHPKEGIKGCMIYGKT